MSVAFVCGAAALACGGSTQSQSARAGRPPSFNDVAPLLYERCAGCHRPGQGAPFSLLTYEDAERRATKISRAVQTRHMPPWLPERNDPGFVDERRLADEEIQRIVGWVDAGAPEGDRSARPAPPSFAGEWQLGQPDLIVTPTRAYPLSAGHEDIFRNLVIRSPIATTKYVRAVEFLPGSAPVHHAVVHVDRTPASRRLDGSDGQAGFEGMGGGSAVQEPAGHFIGWAPGRGPIVAPSGLPWVLEAGTDLVVELHLMPHDIPHDEQVPVQPRIGLFFADAPPALNPVFVKLGSKAIDIPAGAHDYAIEDSFTLPVDVDLLSIYPHAHYLGHEMQVRASLPDGSTRSLLDIRHWSFHWQQDYRYVKPVPLPRGTTIAMRFTYDNSSDNPDNPSKPPKHVTAGQRSTDEMGNLGLQLLPHSRADRYALERVALQHDTLANVAGGEMLVRNNPDNAENQRFLGGSYADVGRLADALPHLEIAVRLDPSSASAYADYGGALLKLGRTTEAVTALQRAATLAPQDPRMAFNLGKGLVAAGKPADAARAFERALALNPALPEAHDELGVLLFARGQLQPAIRHLERAVELDPDSVIAQSDLGGALAQAGRYAEAREHIQRALELDPTYGPARENLARLPR